MRAFGAAREGFTTTVCELYTTPSRHTTRNRSRMQPFHLPPLTGRRERIPVTTHVWALVGIALFFGSAAPSAQKSTGKLTSDDLVEIQQLYARYNWTLDSGDAEGYASTFIPEGVFNNNVGHDAIVKFANT